MPTPVVLNTGLFAHGLSVAVYQNTGTGGVPAMGNWKRANFRPRNLGEPIETQPDLVALRRGSG